MSPHRLLPILALAISTADARPALLSLYKLRGGLDAKWTPNGEAPAPYSTNARQQMGMDPQAMAGMAGGQQGAPAQAPGAAFKFSLLALLVMYICNNYKIVEAVQEIVMKLLKPFLDAKAAKEEAAAKQDAADAAAAARKARAARLKAQASGGGSKSKKAPAPADDDDEEEEEDEDDDEDDDE